MKTTTEEIPAVLIVQTGDSKIVEELKSLFPEEDVSESKRAVGGTEFKAWFTLGSDIIGKVLTKLSANHTAKHSAEIVIGKESISITGSSLEDAEKFLSSEEVQKVIDAYAQPPS